MRPTPPIEHRGPPERHSMDGRASGGDTCGCSVPSHRCTLPTRRSQPSTPAGGQSWRHHLDMQSLASRPHPLLPG